MKMTTSFLAITQFTQSDRKKHRIHAAGRQTSKSLQYDSAKYHHSIRERMMGRCYIETLMGLRSQWSH